MSTIQTNIFSINGVISSDKTVLQNINELCSACGAFATYDIAEGRWAVIINKAEATAVANFNDSNIIGGINISGTGVNELYNQATIQFPHRDLRDQTDYIDLEIPSADRFPNELDNRLNISTDLVSDPIQAQYLASVELKQSRLDKIIEFRTDYSKIGLKAGDVISVTSDVYGYSSKKFRITRIKEDDSDVLVISITALEYSDDLYSTTGLLRKVREKKTGIVPKAANTALSALDNQSSLKLEATTAAKNQGISLFFANTAFAAANGLLANTWYVDFAGQKAQIAASEVVIEWAFDDGEDLDIRARIASPNVGQTFGNVDQYVGWTGGSGQFPAESARYWPLGSSGGTGGTAYIEWGGDNTGVGGNAGAREAVRIDIDRLKATFPTKKYIVVECRGNWYSQRGRKPVRLEAVLYQGGSTSLSGYTFVNTTSTRGRVLASQGVFVDSLHGGAVEADGYDGRNAPGDLMGYFVFNTVANEGIFTQTYYPEFDT